MSRLVSLLTALVTLAACGSPTAPRTAEQSAKAKAALSAASKHVAADRRDRLASN